MDIGKLPPNYGEILVALGVKRNRTKMVLRKLEAQLLEDTHIIYRRYREMCKSKVNRTNSGNRAVDAPTPDRTAAQSETHDAEVAASEEDPQTDDDNPESSWFEFEDTG